MEGMEKWEFWESWGDGKMRCDGEGVGRRRDRSRSDKRAVGTKS
jgi:hypothetical protein